MKINSQVSWSNQSVLRFAGTADPITCIEATSQKIVLDAIDKGWIGPPYDPFKLADVLGIKLVARDDLHEARTTAGSRGEPIIEFNPNRPRTRIRFSIAHEIIHTRFSDFHHKPRYRSGSTAGDEWQLELLCNLGAAELLMPAGSMGAITSSNLSIDWILDKRKELEVSTEALLMRAVRLADFPCAMFCISRLGTGDDHVSGRLDYLVSSRAWSVKVRKADSVQITRTLSECAAIGFTAKGTERWPLLGESVRVECIGLPAYEGLVLPRVVGLLIPQDAKGIQSLRHIEYLKGDVLAPRGAPPHIIAQILNDKTANWGGRGLAVALKAKWPAAQESYRAWIATNRKRLRLGNTHAFEVAPSTFVFNMIAQYGYGPSETPRIRYGAIRQCLETLSEFALEQKASVHMPRIGTGQARGSWEVIEELVKDILLDNGVPVTVYDLPR